MKILLDKQNYVISYAETGDIIGSISAEIKIPEDFKSGLYKFENNKMIKDKKKEKELLVQSEENNLFSKFIEEKTKKEFENWKKQL